jgi:hypothetical protein
MESYHHIGTHADTLEPLFPARSSWVADNAGGPWSLLRMPAARAADGEGEAASPAGLPFLPGLKGWQRETLVAVVVYPFHLFALTPESMAWYQVLPSAPDRFELRIHLCLPRHTAEAPGLAEPRRALREVTRAIHAQDIAACEAVWAGVNARGEAPGRLHRLEGAIWQQNQWWIERMVGAPGPARGRRDHSAERPSSSSQRR